MPHLSDVELATVCSALASLFSYRNWTPDARSRPVRHRLRFRFYGSSPSVRVVALFADVPPKARNTDDDDDDSDVPTIAPTAASLDAAVRDADDETSATAADKQLVVLALHSDVPPSGTTSVARSLYADAQSFVDAVNLDARRSRVCYVEHWHLRQLAIDVLRHADVSPHRLATADERSRYPVAHLPLLRLSDPVARWLGARESDIVVEERDDEDTGRSLYFRRVVAYGGDS